MNKNSLCEDGKCPINQKPGLPFDNPNLSFYNPDLWVDNHGLSPTNPDFRSIIQVYLNYSSLHKLVNLDHQLKILYFRLIFQVLFDNQGVSVENPGLLKLVQ